jgi:hypothetical protein
MDLKYCDLFEVDEQSYILHYFETITHYYGCMGP